MASGYLTVKSWAQISEEEVLEVAGIIAEKDNRVSAVYEAYDCVVDKSKEFVSCFVLGANKKGMPVNIVVTILVGTEKEPGGIDGWVDSVEDANLG